MKVLVTRARGFVGSRLLAARAPEQELVALAPHRRPSARRGGPGGAVTEPQPRIAYCGSSAQCDLLGDNAAMKEILGVPPPPSLRDGLRGLVEHLSAASAV